MEPDVDLLTVADVMRRTQLSRDLVLKAISKGELSAKLFGGPAGWRIRRSDYEAWLATPTPTKRQVEELARTIRAEQARTPFLAHLTVAQVVDNPVDTQHPRGWSVQVLDAHTGNLAFYVSTYQEWETKKAQWMPPKGTRS
jgi:excisionase family DNA binding protein